MRIGIVGAGASGMAAAIEAARCGAQVTLFERNTDPGKKLLSTGNGRCNLTNTRMGSFAYYCSLPSFVDSVLARFGAEDTIAFFRELGLFTHDREGYVYPLSDSAAAVLKCLVLGLRKAGARLLTEALVKDVKQVSDGYELTFTREGETRVERFDRVILSCGGMAVPKTGSDGKGYYILSKLGVLCNPPTPALCALYVKKPLEKAAGVRAAGRVSLWSDRVCLGSDAGEIQLTDYGISGIPVFTVSRYAAIATEGGRYVEARIDFLPEVSEEEWQAEFDRRVTSAAGESALELLSGVLHEKLLRCALEDAGLDPERQVSAPSEETIAKLREAWKLLRYRSFRVLHAADFAHAQTSTGGVSLSEVSEDLELRYCPGLFLTGEMLDVDGICGGYNLQFAWSTGILAGRKAAEGGSK